MQYTIRGVPSALDSALRKRAHRAGTSLNEAVLETLADGLGLTAQAKKRRDLSDLIGTWKPDRALEEAIADQDRIDPELWR
ncbi:MAG: hypothetical protein WCE97_12490 [Candidatus Cybelea sp.]|jgi:hypothetical protein